MGHLVGIARHARPKGPMETVGHVGVTCATGIDGDYRGAMRGGPYRRQVTLLAREDWEAALAEIDATIHWKERRANLLIEGLKLPRRPGTRLRIGTDVVLEITRETDPCERMEALAPGLKAALIPDWRGGVCSFVVTEGQVVVGDSINVEDAV